MLNYMIKFLCIVMIGMCLVNYSFAVDNVTNIGNAQGFALLASKEISAFGDSSITGDIGLSGENTQLTPIKGTVKGNYYTNDKSTEKAIADAKRLVDTIRGNENKKTVTGNINRQTFTSGIIRSNDSISISDEITLDGENNSDANFYFQFESLMVYQGARINLINGAKAQNVYWILSSGATIGKEVEFKGNIIAKTDIKLIENASILGSVVSLDGSISLNSNKVIIQNEVKTSISIGQKIIMKIGMKEAMLNGKSNLMDVPPYIKAGRTYVPVSFVTQQLGGAASYTPDEKGKVKYVVLTFKDTTVEMEVGSKIVKVKRGIFTTSMESDAAVEITNGRTMIPFNTLGQALNAKIDFGMKLDNSAVEWVSFEI